MTFGRTITAFVAAAFVAVGGVSIASAHDGEEHNKPQNLKVIKDKELKPGMKLFNKGLGVKCEACHVKGKFESDDKAEKEAGRKFFTAVVGEKDTTKRDAALKELLDALKLKEAKSPDDLWKAVGMFEKK
jgi:hypothetical protein